MTWHTQFSHIGNVIYKHHYISVLYLSNCWHGCTQTLTISIFVVLWTWNLKLNLCSMFFFSFFLMRMKSDDRKNSLFPTVHSLVDILKAICNDQRNMGVYVYMEKNHIHKQGCSVWMFQEEQNEKLIPDSVRILLLFN